MIKVDIENLLLKIGFRKYDVFEDSWKIYYNNHAYIFGKRTLLNKNYEYVELLKYRLDGDYPSDLIFHAISTDYEKMSYELKNYFKYILRTKKIKKLL